jgi:hypothetical protein
MGLTHTLGLTHTHSAPASQLALGDGLVGPGTGEIVIALMRLYLLAFSPSAVRLLGG